MKCENFVFLQKDDINILRILLKLSIKEAKYMKVKKIKEQYFTQYFMVYGLYIKNL
jgi:hypothetical protein